MEIPNVRILMLVAIVLAILFYMSTLLSGGGMQQFDNFADLGQSVNAFTMYYMNGCPHCESILPEYRQFVASGQIETNGSKTKIRMLEQGDPNAAPELEAHNVKGFPTFIMTTVDGKTIEYKGERTVEAMRDFIATNAKHL
jgi:hypothetical protein